MSKIYNFLLPRNMPENWKEGDSAPWRKALGYAWSDIDKRTPGIDLRWDGDTTKDRILNELKKTHGKLVVAKSDYGIFDKGENNKLIQNIDGLKQVARFCGAIERVVYSGVAIYKKEVELEDDYRLNPDYKNIDKVTLKQKEKEYDQLHNEGGEGYNPYRDNLYISVK